LLGHARNEFQFEEEIRIHRLNLGIVAPKVAQRNFIFKTMLGNVDNRFGC
jgi:hypothetical protein